MKKCSKCSEIKSINQFATRGNGKSHAYCKDCQKAYSKKHYQRNKEEHKARAAKRHKTTRAAHLEKIAKIKQVPCADCGLQYPHYVMELDHVRGSKVSHISDMPGSYGWCKIEEEIEKCDVVCANCHRERTWQRSIQEAESSSLSILTILVV